MKIEDDEIEFSDGFTDLHTVSYKKILEGNGFELNEARKSIEMVYNIRTMQPKGLVGNYHPFANQSLTHHPFEKP
jgi:UDP-N-acetyl-2-amino-2-deoxyglucuronate dehydrogenase